MTFPRFAWAVLAYNVAVVAWGAFVRATGSGAGCGKHWPLCNGEVVPRAPAIETAIEFTHRVTSGVALALVVGLAVWAFRAYPRGHPVRRAATGALAFMIAEALVGAGLVLFGWVAKDASFARGWVMAIHLVSTFLLLGALALAADWATHAGGVAPGARGGRGGAGALWLAVTAVLVAGVTGGVAALGDTLFPATSFAAGLSQELSTGAHVLLRLRVLHPFAALAAGALLLAFSRLAIRARPEDRVRRPSLALALLVAVEIAAGVLNVLLLAPVWLQVLHLVAADLLWIALVLLGSALVAPGEARAPRRAAAHAVA
jgi:cytochrome c oxidase assembly protein subunit 15